jgi:hypothetical protein
MRNFKSIGKMACSLSDEFAGGCGSRGGGIRRVFIAPMGEMRGMNLRQPCGTHEYYHLQTRGMHFKIILN